MSFAVTLRPVGYLRRSSRQVTVRPFAVVVLAISFPIGSYARNRSPRQFDEIKENRRCSILFHLLVPGGKWHTDKVKPDSSANLCSSTFHKRNRQPLLPPPSAVISSVLPLG